MDTTPALPSPSTSPGRRAALGGRYWRLWFAASISNIGDGMLLVALPLLASKATSSSVQIALVTAFGAVPWMFASLHAGAIIDRSDKRRVMIACDVGRAVVIAGLVGFTALGTVHMWVLWALAFGLGFGEVFFDNASTAILPAVVDGDQLETANGRRFAAEMTARNFVGVPLGGILFGFAVWLPFGVDAVSFVASAALVVGMTGRFRAAPPDTATTTTLTGDVRAAVGWVWRSELLRGLAVVLTLLNVSFGMITGLFVLYVKDELHLSVRWYGWLVATMTAGAIVAGLIGDRLVRKMGNLTVLYVANLVRLAVMLAIGLFPAVWVVVVAEWVGAFGVTLWNVSSSTIRQRYTPPAMLGRVSSIFRWCAYGSVPAGAAIGGLVAGMSNQRVPYLVSAGLIIVCFAVMARTVRSDTLRDAGERVGITT